MTRYVVWVQVAQMLFLDPRPQGQSIIWDIINLLDLSYDHGENETLFVKNELGFCI